MRDPHYEERFFELLNKAEAEDYSPNTGPWLEEAYRLADEQKDPEFGLLARYFYVFAVAPMEPRSAVVAFAWCLAHKEHVSDMIPMTSLAHLYGIVAGILRSFPEYSLEQIERTFEEMEEQFRALGLPMRDVWHHRLYGALGVGARDEARAWYERWSASPMSSRDCPVCELGTRVLYHLYLEEYDDAFRLAAPIWDGLRCPDGQPLMTAAASLIPLLRVGEFDRAAHCHRQVQAELDVVGYAGIWAAGRELAYLSAVGAFEEAKQSFERYLPRAWSSGTPADRFGFLIAAKLFGMRALEVGERIDLKIPKSCELYDPTGAYATRRVEKFFSRQLDELGERFDRRNGNGEYMRIARLTDDIYRGVREEIG